MIKPVFYILSFLIGLILQFSFSQYISINGLAPNFILIFIVFLSLMRGSITGQAYGFLWGLSWDVFSVRLFGCHAFIFTCLGYFLGLLSKKWDENKLSTQVFLTLVCSIFYWLALILLYQFFGDGKLQVNYIMILQPLINMLLAPPVFRVCSLLVDYFDIDEKRY
ncbi:MAG: rod shape-determining protein MreD [Elusimicrobia bacterium]|nr:rod shape-determining protein MreD [Candidatus Liberimonas magnetica]